MRAKPPPEVAHMERTPACAAPMAILDDADLILNLADDDSGFAGVVGHPVKDAGGGAHRIGTVELTPAAAPPIARALLPLRTAYLFSVMGRGQAKGFEVCRGVVVAGAGNADVLVDDCLLLLAELLDDDAFESGKADAIMLRAAPMARVFCATLLRVMSASLETGMGQSWTPAAAVPGWIWSAL